MKFLRPIFRAVILLFAWAAANAVAQSITGFSPAFGTTNESVVISGSGFTDSGGSPVITNVSFNTKAASFFVSSDTQITAIVPVGATTGAIKVSRPGGQATTPTNFTVIGLEPYITSFSPTSGSASTVVTMTGVHFTGVNIVKFNGTNGSVTSLTSDTTIQVTAPPANVTTGPISLTRSNTQTGITASNFFVSPIITSFSPTNGRPGTNIVIVGKNFIGTTAVNFNGFSATSFTNVGNTQLNVTVPAGASTGFINVVAPGGQFTTTSNFFVLPTITGFSPFIGNAGTNVTITGFNLTPSPVVHFTKGSAAVIVGTPTATQIVATVPASGVSGPISVTTTNGTVTTISNFFMPPSITVFSPTNGAAGTNVLISGSNFTNATDVSFNGTPATFTVVNNDFISATVPAGATSGKISVTAPAGTTNSPAAFYFQPVVSSFTPGAGIAGASVTVNGSNFLDATAVKFNGVNATFTPGNNFQLSAIVPTNATTGPISVVAPGGTGVSAANFIVDTVSLSIKLLTNLNAVTVSWTTNALGYILQANTNVATTNTWVPVTNVPAIVSGKNTVTNAITNSPTFYRLKK